MSADRQWRRDEEVPAAVLDAIQQAVVLHGRQQTQGSDARDIAVALYEDGECVAGGWGRTVASRIGVTRRRGTWTSGDVGAGSA